MINGQIWCETWGLSSANGSTEKCESAVTLGKSCFSSVCSWAATWMQWHLYAYTSGQDKEGHFRGLILPCARSLAPQGLPELMCIEGQMSPWPWFSKFWAYCRASEHSGFGMDLLPFAALLFWGMQGVFLGGILLLLLLIYKLLGSACSGSLTLASSLPKAMQKNSIWVHVWVQKLGKF